MRTGNLATFLLKLNAARQSAPTYPADPDPKSPDRPSAPALKLTDIPATAVGQQNLLFQERALTLFLSGHRVGDLRRLTYQYGRPTESVWPTGPYQLDNPDKQGTNYAGDVNLPIPQEESNNPAVSRGKLHEPLGGHQVARAARVARRSTAPSEASTSEASLRFADSRTGSIASARGGVATRRRKD